MRGQMRGQTELSPGRLPLRHAPAAGWGKAPSVPVAFPAAGRELNAGPRREAQCRRAQKVNLALSWTRRAPRVEVKRPKFPAVMPVEMPEKLVWFRALSKSPRSWSR